MRVSLRFFKPEDQERLEDVCKHVFGGDDYMPKQSMKFHKDPKVDFYVIEADGVFAGCTLTTYYDAGRTAYFFGIRIAKEFEGKGIAMKSFPLQIALAFQKPGVQRMRLTRNLLSKQTGRMMEKHNVAQIMTNPLIRVQQQGVVTLLEHMRSLRCGMQLEQCSISQLLRLWSELSEEEKKKVNSHGNVLLQAWKVSQMEYLEEFKEMINSVLVELDSKGKLKSFSVSGSGDNSKFGKVLWCFVSENGCVSTHVLEHLRGNEAFEDVEVLCEQKHQERYPKLFEFNVSFYKRVVISTNELVKAKARL